MNEQDIIKFLKILEKEKEAIATKTKEESIAFLRSVGILTKSGKVAKPYKNLCIPKEQA
ncbi:MAG TPA: hypothetical protein PKX92_13715 [Edaphocola sp.]|nr:hypothetical protein [Edaphocola sp.]